MIVDARTQWWHTNPKVRYIEDGFGELYTRTRCMNGEVGWSQRPATREPQVKFQAPVTPLGEIKRGMR